LNLASNAVKFHERGTVRIEVSRLDGAQLKISVADSGIGIAAEQLDRLFRRFTQADSSTTRRYAVPASGSRSARRLVELMGGTIGAQSHQGTGRRFGSHLPLIAGQQPQTDTKAAQSPAVPTWWPLAAEPVRRQCPHPPRRPHLACRPHSAGRRLRSRVLLVEDNFVNERVAVYMLTKLGHQVDVAKHGREAIDMLGKAGYDLVLMDCQMPEMDGFEATRVIRDRSSAVLDS